ncbi:MAG: putative nicotinamide N-methyase [Halioglobus sp.]|jgi:predicted nicotinamide N-methyase
MEEQKLISAVCSVLPGATLEATTLPDYPLLQLLLLSRKFPQHTLSSQQIARLMEEPLYWVFCWASGQIMARFIRDEPNWVKGKRVLDFGSGSGVVAIAAAQAGASEVVACDTDALALMAAQYNAGLNKVKLTLVADFFEVDGDIDLIVAADVLYDRENLIWLERFNQRADRVLVADSRIKDFDYPPYREIARHDSCTLPDMDESSEFRDVRIYCSGRVPLPNDS